MHLTYQKLGTDHPMYGKVEALVADGTKPICYKTKDGYIPLEEGAAPVVASSEATEVNTKPLYVLSFKVNDEAEEMTFTSKKKLDKTIALFSEKEFISDLKTTTHNIVA
ncbi:hypothetical protein THMIRHAM_22460 [Thiomicrorhabdus immobilis]|uniref:Head decoration protein n=1 Tax=Thiomicrorhabdus immobilis TaxID=2791037 RepID=A0ABN6CZI6_9GAMM|nr:hypothetical protein [Thiomicrorhabdus immobilis]BCN94461.1 hypothetical protein THMIRHAM_22460 [Thiomicrorhabdus immobilis]